MGATFSFTFADFDDFDSQVEAVLLRSISFGAENTKSALLRSVSFNGRESEPVETILKSYGSAKFVLEGSLSFKGRRELESMLSFKTPTASFENEVFGRTISSKIRDLEDQLSKSDTFSEEIFPSPVVEPVEDGILKAVWPHSGHYLPTEENFQEFMTFLEEHNVDLANVKKSPSDEETTGFFSKANSLSKPPSIKNSGTTHSEVSGTDSTGQDPNAAENQNLMSRLPSKLCSKLTTLEIPTRNNLVFDIFKKETLPTSCHSDHRRLHSTSEEESGYETAEESFLTEEDFMFPKSNLFEDDDEEEEDEKPIIPKEKIMKRIVSHKGMKSYQLAQQLSARWSTGAGPRIGCMRDYPSELQFRVLEQANLSPRSKGSSSSPRNPSRLSQRALTNQNSLRREIVNAVLTPQFDKKQEP
uniref:Uncharacterized protein n=1 Tax=Cannabis sativa TaxID=3483 RepID=A0A803QPA8_CANSA